MTEKKQVLYDLRSSYNGPFVVEDFYAEVDNWIIEKDYVKEQKKKSEHVTKNGKRIEWLIEIQSHLDDLHHGVVVLRVFMDDVKEAIIKREGKKMRINNGNVLITINGFIEAHVHGSFYQVKPVYYFIKTLIDKYVYNFWQGRYDGNVRGDGEAIFKRLNSFLNLQRYNYE